MTMMVMVDMMATINMLCFGGNVEHWVHITYATTRLGRFRNAPRDLY